MPAQHIDNRRPLATAVAPGLANRLVVGTIALAAVVAIALMGPDTLSPARANGASVHQLGFELNAKQAQLTANQAAQQHLSARVGSLRSEIGTLSGQISLVQSRETQVATSLELDRTRLLQAQAILRRERTRATVLRRDLARAREILATQLVSRYEQPQPNLVSVVLNAHGFDQLLEQVDYLSRAERQQQSAIAVASIARAQTEAVTVRIVRMAAGDREMADATAVQARALQGMNRLLRSRQTILSDLRSAQQTALAAAQSRGVRLRAAIASVQSQQAAAERAAAAAQEAATPRAAGATGSSASTGLAIGSGGWAIPAAVVICESGGQNLPPNSADASGYYQILPSTWQQFGGSGPAAYLASKSEQDTVASRIWNGGSGASNWVCSSIVGIP